MAWEDSLEGIVWQNTTRFCQRTVLVGTVLVQYKCVFIYCIIRYYKIVQNLGNLQKVLKSNLHFWSIRRMIKFGASNPQGLINALWKENMRKFWLTLLKFYSNNQCCESGSVRTQIILLHIFSYGLCFEWLNFNWSKKYVRIFIALKQIFI